MNKIIFCLLFCTCTIKSFAQKNDFVTTRGHHFFVNGQPYHYIGANYWYGALLGLTPNGRERLKKELDFLKQKGVINLRVLAAAEGEGLISGVLRVEPAFQPEKGMYKKEVLAGLDFLLSEMGKRNMKAVLYLTNNWEWSDGFLQYLNWNGLLPDSTMRHKLTWEDQSAYTSKFYTCTPCIQQEAEVIKKIVGRTNTITHKKYADDAAIMSWELANEPRPMEPEALNAYNTWISGTAASIKKLDKNHMVTAGIEGDIGTGGMDNFIAMQQNKNIDYATIHIWPKNWGWFSDTSIAKGMDTIIKNTQDYISRHVLAMQKVNKPLVIEEFGLPRDEHLFTLKATTHSRDEYYSFMFNQLLSSVKEGGVINGANFWAFGGMGRPTYKQKLWQKGEDMLGDPPFEEQGLNTVFDADISTWKLITNFIKKLNKIGK